MLDILQQVWSGYLSSWSSSNLVVQLNTPMTTPTSCGTADHQFLEQETILDDVIPVEIGYLSS